MKTMLLVQKLSPQDGGIPVQIGKMWEWPIIVIPGQRLVVEIRENGDAVAYFESEPSWGKVTLDFQGRR